MPRIRKGAVAKMRNLTAVAIQRDSESSSGSGRSLSMEEHPIEQQADPPIVMSGHEPENDLTRLDRITKIVQYITEFNGSNMPVARFIKDCNNASLYLHEGDMSMFIQKLLTAKITGPAYTQVASKDFENLKDLLNCLDQTYRPSGDIHKLQNDLAKSKQASDETVIVFGNRVQGKLLEIIATIQDDQNTDPADVAALKRNALRSAIQCFLDGVKKDVSNFILNTKFDNLEDAILAAKRMELKLGNRNRLYEDEIQAQATASKRMLPIKNEPGTSKGAGNKLNNNNVQDNKDKSNLLPECYKCRKRGHLKKDCPQLQVECYNCGRKGHIKRDCRQPKAKNNNPNQLCKFCKSPNHPSKFCRNKPTCEYCNKIGHKMEECWFKKGFPKPEPKTEKPEEDSSKSESSAGAAGPVTVSNEQPALNS